MVGQEKPAERLRKRDGWTVGAGSHVRNTDPNTNRPTNHSPDSCNFNFKGNLTSIGSLAKAQFCS